MENWWLAIIFFFIFLWVTGPDHKKQAAAMKAVASRLGLDFESRANLLEVMEHDLDGFYTWVGREDKPYEVINHIHGQIDEATISIFNFRTRIHRENFRGVGILVSGLRSGIPWFSLRPETFLTREFGPGTRDIDFESHPEFSNSYNLHAANPEAAREFFDSGVLDYFTKNRNPGNLMLEGRTMFAMARPDSPAEIGQLLGRMMATKSLLEDRAAALSA